MKADKFIFQIRKCEDSTWQPGDPECAKDDEIEEYIRRQGIYVETWVNHQKIDWNLY